jgi:hypothetical protein
MINTTLAILALTAGMDLSVPPTNLKWQTDYSQAMTSASQSHKPMAVFIGRGEEAVKKLVAEGTITADAAKVLTSNYVLVYLDTNTETGKDLAKSFDMNQGLVISGPGGSVQAYRHSGAVTSATLAQTLSRYASAGQPTTTVSAGDEAPRATTVPSGYVIVPGNCPNGNCQMVVPAGQFTFPGSSCPNGRCPNQR